MPTVTCPACLERLALGEAYRDWTVRCPHCGREFEADDNQLVEPPDGDSPATDEDREAARELALPMVFGPAVALEVCGWGAAVASAALGLIFFIEGVQQVNNQAPNAANANPFLFVYLGCCLGLFGVPYFAAMAAGGRQMRAIGSRNWAVAGALLAVASLLFFGVCGLVFTAVGAWAFAALEKPAVRRAFGLPSRAAPRDR